MTLIALSLQGSLTMTLPTWALEAALQADGQYQSDSLLRPLYIIFASAN